MDGVLIDSEPAHKLAEERAFAKFGIVLPEAVYERHKGRPDETMMNEVARSIPGRKLDVDELLRIKHSEFEAIEQIAVPIEGAKALVNWAKSRFQVALATSATPRNRQAALSVLGLADTFDFVVDASGFSRPKPDPEIFLTVISGLKAVAAPVPSPGRLSEWSDRWQSRWLLRRGYHDVVSGRSPFEKWRGPRGRALKGTPCIAGNSNSMLSHGPRESLTNALIQLGG